MCMHINNSQMKIHVIESHFPSYGGLSAVRWPIVSPCNGERAVTHKTHVAASSLEATKTN